MGLIIALTGVLLLAGCTNTKETPQKEALIVAGSTTVQPIAAKAAEKYMEKNLNVAISVQGGGSGTGIKMVTEGSADIGMSSRELYRRRTNIQNRSEVYEIAQME